MFLFRVRFYENQVVFAVERFQENWTVLIPILLWKRLQSPKILDFIDYFKAAIVIYLGKDINYTNYCSKLKSGMNSARTDFSFYSVYPIRITLNWLIGFIEGDAGVVLRSKTIPGLFQSKFLF